MDEKINYSKIYSPFKLGMYSQCPKRYHFYYLDPIYSRMRNELKRHPHNIWSFNTLGKAVHNAITLFYHLPTEERTDQSLLEQLKKTWASEVMWNKKPPLGKWGGFKSLEEERESYRQAISMLKKFFKIAEIEPEIEYLPAKDLRKSIDDYKKLITPLNEDLDISGTFDLIINDDGFLHIIDFKTGKRENNGYFQLKFYKLLAEEKFGKLVKKASFYFLRTGNEKEFDLADESTEGIRDEIVERVSQIEATDEFEPKPGKLCKFCLFKNFCPEKEKVAEITKDVSDEDYCDDLPF